MDSNISKLARSLRKNMTKGSAICGMTICEITRFVLCVSVRLVNTL